MNQDWLLFHKVFDTQKSFVLATIVATVGSTYRKAGAMILVDENQCFGLLSGGCLEEDIRLHAGTCFEAQQQKILEYDLRNDSELLWGLGLGCEGAITILLQPLTPENQHAGFQDVLDKLVAGKRGYLVQMVKDQVPTQMSFLESISNYPLSVSDQKLLNNGRSLLLPDSILVSHLRPAVQLLVCGAGPDVLPLSRMASELGWQVHIWDHRKALLDVKRFPDNTLLSCVKSSESVSMDFPLDAAVVMTHHLEWDEAYLKILLESELKYVGLLGPQKRRDKILSNLGCTYDELKHRLFAPVGLDIGTHTPETIALSILAEIQQQLFGVHQ